MQGGRPHEHAATGRIGEVAPMVPHHRGRLFRARRLDGCLGLVRAGWGWLRPWGLGVGFGLGVLGLVRAAATGAVEVWELDDDSAPTANVGQDDLVAYICRQLSLRVSSQSSQWGGDHVDTMIDSILDGRRLRGTPLWKYSRALGSGRAAAVLFSFLFF